MRFYPNVIMHVGDNSIWMSMFGWTITVATDSNVDKVSEEFLRLAQYASSKVLRLASHCDEPLVFDRNLVMLASELDVRIGTPHHSRLIFSSVTSEVAVTKEFLCRISAGETGDRSRLVIAFYDESMESLFRKSQKIKKFLNWFFQDIDYMG